MVEKKLEIIGFDVGNGFLKISSLEKDQIIESVYAEYDGGINVMGEQDQDEGINVYIPTKFGSEKYVLGQTAVDRYAVGGAINTIDMNGRLDRRTFQILLQLGLAHILPKANDVKLLIVTGVPEEESLAESQKLYDALLTGVNVIEVNGESRVRYVQTIKALHQPSGLLFDLYLDGEGYVRDGEIVKGQTLIIDIGEGTTDVSVFHGLRKTNGFSLKLGTSEVSRRILAEISSKAKASVTLADVQQAVRNHSTYLSIGREQFEIDRQGEIATQNVIDRILSQIQSRIPNRDEYNRVVVGGGGAGFFENFIKSWQNDAIISSDQTAIARGFRKYGVAMARREELT